MERLTEKNNGVCVYIGPGCKFPNSGEISAEMDVASVRNVLQRLAAYEDTGLEPEEVKDLQLEVTALKTIEAMYDGLGHPDHLRELVEAEEDGRVLPFVPVGMVFDTAQDKVTSMGPVVVTFDYGDGQNKFNAHMPLGVFIQGLVGGQLKETREEAEAALEDMKGDSHEADSV